jgi:hypothetical protein
VPTEFRNQRFATHIFNNHKQELLENHEKQLMDSIKYKRPYMTVSYKIKGEEVKKWLCFASGISCISLSWMQKHNQKHKALGSAHLEMMQNLITDKEKILKPEPVCTEGNSELLERIAQLEKENEYLKKENVTLTNDRDDSQARTTDCERETNYLNASIKIYNELLENFYRREGFKEMYKAVEDCMNALYNNNDNYDEEGYIKEDDLMKAKQDAQSIKYDYDMYLGERPKSKEAILEEFCYDNNLDIRDCRY